MSTESFLLKQNFKQNTKKQNVEFIIMHCQKDSFTASSATHLFRFCSLGMRHDGPLAENDCDPSSYIMSSTLGSGKITWSACSRKYLQQFLE